MANFGEQLARMFGFTTSGMDIENYMGKNKYQGYNRGTGHGQAFSDPYRVSQNNIDQDPIMKYITKTGGQGASAARSNAMANYAGTGFGNSSFANAYADKAGMAAAAPYGVMAQQQMGNMQNRAFEADKIGLSLDQFIAQLGEQSRQANLTSYANSRTNSDGGALNLISSIIGMFNPPAGLAVKAAGEAIK